MNWREVLRSIGDLIKQGWNSLSVENQRIILGVVVFLAGGLLPWGRLGEVGGYIQFGLIAAGVLTASMGVKKPGESSFLSKLGLGDLFGKKKGKTRGSDGYCSRCGRRMKGEEAFCSSCGRSRRDLN